MNDTQRKLIHTALKQTNHAKSNLNSAVYLEGLREVPEVTEAYQELERAWKRLWNTLHGDVFLISPPRGTVSETFPCWTLGPRTKEKVAA